MYTYGGQAILGLGDFTFDPSNPLSVSSGAAIEGNTIALGDYINSQVDSVYGGSLPIQTSTISAPTDSSSGIDWSNTLNSLIPGFATTAEKILSTQFSVPQTGAGQYFTTNSKTGVTTTYTLPSAAGSSLSISNPFGANVTSSGNLLPILAIAGIAALFLFNKKS